MEDYQSKIQLLTDKNQLLTDNNQRLLALSVINMVEIESLRERCMMPGTTLIIHRT